MLTLFGCSREEPPVVRAHRPMVPPVMTVTAQTGLVAPHKCLCADIDSLPAPTPYEEECGETGARCGRVHYPDYLARTPDAPELERLGTLVTTHYVESMIYDATISFRVPATADFVAHDSTMRVHAGDVVPTPRGRARVIHVRRSFNVKWDDGEVLLHFLEEKPHEKARWVYVSSGAPSHIDGITLTMLSAEGGRAALAMDDGGGVKIIELVKGSRLTTSKASFKVVDVVDGRVEDALGWVTLDCSNP